MRPRRKKHINERLTAVEALTITKNDYVGIEIDKIFKLKLPLDIEIGCGKGSFAIQHAMVFPERNYIAIEKIQDVIITALEKSSMYNYDNLRFMIADAAALPEILPVHSVDILYINFCDPWPKKRNAKRRLTFHSFLERYKIFLKPDGKIIFKTDNRPLFDFSIIEFKTAGYRLEDITYDLHNSEYNADNVMTEYEKIFSDKGFTINRLIAYLL
ncbi:MAG: tRNA (guanosine(46)-N7)-methyltransferase TrmB [Clostridiales bacterium GWF2_38_85]|nr:MAG: tRNA (guanosine(46)-N7)-methyltransferase TrmB [Clostridiales bacterium GWF2_38_85]